MSLVKEVTLKILTDDKDAEAKLDKISAKADELRAEHPELKIRIDTAEASAKLAVFKEELKAATKDATVDVKEKGGKTGLLGKLLFGDLADEAAGGGGGGNNILGSVFSSGEGFLGFLTSPVGFTAAVAAIGAILTELTGLVAGLSAATAGVGAFGLLALPTFDKIKNAYTAISTAQTNYNNALALEKENPTKANATAVANALTKLHVAQENISPSTRQAISGIDQLKNTFEKMAKAFEPDVMKVFNDGLKIANALLPALKPFADAAAGALDGLLKKAGKFVESKGFKEWLGQFEKLAGPSITAIGTGIGNVVGAFGKLLTVLSKKDVVNAINIAFRILSGTITWTAGLIRILEKAWDGYSNLAKKVAGFLRGSFDQMIRDVENWYHDTVNFLGKAVAWFESLPGKILHVVASFGSLLVNAGKSLIEGLIHGIESMVGGLLGTIGHLASDVGHAFASVLHIFSPSKVFEEHGRNIVRGLVNGIDGESASATAAMRRLGNSLSVGGASGGGGRGGVTVEIHAPSGYGYLPQEFWTQLANGIRTRGGSPEILSRKVAF